MFGISLRYVFDPVPFFSYGFVVLMAQSIFVLWEGLSRFGYLR